METNFGSRLKALRTSKKMSLKDVAERSGVSHPYISQIENKNRNAPKPEIIRKLAKGLNEKPIDLMALAGYFSEEEAEYRKEVLKSSIQSKKKAKKTLQELEDNKRDIQAILIGGNGKPLYNKMELSDQYIGFLYRFIDNTITLNNSELDRIENMIKIMVKKDDQ